MKMSLAYFDCFSGISGDMILGALIQFGVPGDFLEENIRNLPLDAFHLEITTVYRMNIHGQKVRVVVEEKARQTRNYRLSGR